MSAPMVRAVLDGSKTQTRRIVKPQPVPWCAMDDEQTLPFIEHGKVKCLAEFGALEVLCPYGVVGDRLWVRETWAAYTGLSIDGECDEITCTPSEMQERCGTSRADVVYFADSKSAPDRWRPSIHMPRWASRITLEITDVRVERLNDISKEDARAEGVVPLVMDCGSFLPRFEGVWGHVYGPDSWASNPWVWALTFKRVGSAA